MAKTSNKYSALLIYLALALTAFIAFEPVRYCDFTFDDVPYITRNQYIRAGLTREGIAWAFAGRISYWHPLTWLSHMLDCQLFGINPGWHHLTNLLFHIANALLLFSLLKRMTGALWRSAFVAALFALHPLQVESVAWVSERKDVLSTLFWMLTIAAYLRYVKRLGLAWYLLALLSFALGLMAKPMVVTLPFVLLLLDYWPLGRLQPSQLANHSNGQTCKSGIAGPKGPLALRLVAEKVPFFILSAVSIYLSFLSSQRLETMVSTELVPMKLRIANVPVSYVKYIGKIFWPQDLAVFYPFPAMVPMWQSIGALLLLICAFILVICVLRTRPYLAVGWLWYLGTLVPVIGLVQSGAWPAMADRFTYLPSIGIFIILAWGLAELFTGWRHLKIGLAISAAVLLAVLLARTKIQVRYWQNDITLFGHAVEVTENNNLALYNLGNALRAQSKFDEAADCYRQVLKLKPEHAKAHNNLGAVLLEQGKPDQAISHFHQALQIEPNNAGVYYNLANAMSAKDKTEQAITYYRRALHIQPDFVGPLNTLAWLLATHPDQNLRDPSQAIELAQWAAGLTSYQNATILDTLATAYAAAGQFPQAIETAQKALQLAQASQQKQLADGIQNRLLLFRAGQSYIGNGQAKR